MKLITHIAEPFWGAWKIYNWERPIPGIGLSEKIVVDAADNNEKIYVTIGKDPQVYEISPQTVINLAKKYKSIRQVRFGVKVAVVPQSEFKKVIDK